MITIIEFTHTAVWFCLVLSLGRFNTICIISIIYIINQYDEHLVSSPDKTVMILPIFGVISVSSRFFLLCAFLSANLWFLVILIKKWAMLDTLDVILSRHVVYHSLRQVGDNANPSSKIICMTTYICCNSLSISHIYAVGLSKTCNWNEINIKSS